MPGNGLEDKKSFGTVTDVDSDVLAYGKKKHLQQIMFAGTVVLLLEVGCYWFFPQYFSVIIFCGAGILVAAILLFYQWVSLRMKGALMEQFAKSHNWHFQKAGLPKDLDGSMFVAQGDSSNIFLTPVWVGQKETDFITGDLQQIPLCLFNYRYMSDEAVGVGVEPVSCAYTVLRLEYPNPLPSVFLQSTRCLPSDDMSSLFDFLPSKQERIRLEGNFSKFFMVSVKKGFEEEALQILSPDFMEKMEADGKDFSVEFINNHAYLYACWVITVREDLEHMYQLAQYLVEKIKPLNVEMKGSLEALSNYYR